MPTMPYDPVTIDRLERHLPPRPVFQAHPIPTPHLPPAGPLREHYLSLLGDLLDCDGAPELVLVQTTLLADLVADRQTQRRKRRRAVKRTKAA